MINFTFDETGIPLSVPAEHGPLQGRLTLLPIATAIIVITNVTSHSNAREDAMATAFRSLKIIGLARLNAAEAGASTHHIDNNARQLSSV